MTVSGNWVDRDRLIESLANCAHERNCQKCLYWETENDCRDAMLWDVSKLLKEQEAKHGQWVRLTGMAPPEYHGHKVCSLCESMAPHHPLHIAQEILTPYCPGCGAKMEGAAK